jgi:hypothetical protein
MLIVTLTRARSKMYGGERAMIVHRWSVNTAVSKYNIAIKARQPRANFSR